MKKILVMAAAMLFSLQGIHAQTDRIPKFRRTNQNMTIDLRPICNKGQRVKKGDILTEGV